MKKFALRGVAGKDPLLEELRDLLFVFCTFFHRLQERYERVEASATVKVLLHFESRYYMTKEWEEFYRKYRFGRFARVYGSPTAEYLAYCARPVWMGDWEDSWLVSLLGINIPKHPEITIHMTDDDWDSFWEASLPYCVGILNNTNPSLPARSQLHSDCNELIKTMKDKEIIAELGSLDICGNISRG